MLTANKKALVVIDIQNDITKHYRDIIEKINAAIDWATEEGMEIVYIQHNNLSAGTRTFKPDTKGAELVPELKVVSGNIFVKSKPNALTSEAFTDYIQTNGISEFFITGADATACVKSTCLNMVKTGYTVHVISDCITSYDLKKLPEMLAYYADKGCEVKTLEEYTKPNAITIRKLSANEIPAALELAWRTFSEYESPDYAPEGTEEFRKCLHDDAYLFGIEYYGAFDGEKLIGEIGIRPDRMHICFFFVDGSYHRRGIGTGLFRYLRTVYPHDTITLNSSPYGLPFYKAIGFVSTEDEKTVKGIRFTPMKHDVQK